MPPNVPPIKRRAEARPAAFSICGSGRFAGWGLADVLTAKGSVGMMMQAYQVSGSDFDAGKILHSEDQRLRALWAAAWLREYRCHIRYLSLLALDAVEDLELRFAWLEWWNAACVCRDALGRLEGIESELVP